MKAVRGEITAFLALLLIFFLSFFTVLLEGIRVENARTAGERALNLGMSSVFAEYYRPLWEEYHLFGLSGEELEQRIKEYMVLSYGLVLEELEIEEQIWGSDYEGMLFLHQVQAYEKYRGIDSVLGRDFAGRFLAEADAALSGDTSEGAVDVPEDLEENEEGRQERKKMKSLKELWGENIMKLVLENPALLSKKGLVSAPAAGEGRYSISSTNPKKNLRQVKQFLKEQEVQQAELSYYRRHFKSYCKQNIAFQKEESCLDYEMEYLLEGRGNDRDNIEAWLRRLVLVRTALNYLNISRDGTKSQSAYTMAFSALGFTGLEPLIRAGQQFILLGWSYEEALIDAAVLSKGGSVSLWKSNTEFSISFGEIFSFSQETVRKKVKVRLTENPRLGMDYEAYLSLFLNFKKEEKRRAAAWYLIDENMRLRYDKEFSFRDTVFGLQVRAEYLLSGRLGRDWKLTAQRHYSY